MTNTVTIFKNILETDLPFHRPISKVLERIQDGASKDLIKQIRAEKDKPRRQALKKKLPSICFSGEFTKRADSSLIQHSGYICLDFDGYDKKKELMQDKEKFSKDKHSMAVFVSPSGNGLKVIIKIPPEPENHVNYFNSLKTHFDSPYFDKTSKNVSRVCYESYDPQMYINETSSVWDVIEEPEYREVVKHKDPPTLVITDEDKIQQILIKWWQKKHPMVEGNRNHNVYVLCRAFNDYGVSKSIASFILKQYATKGFPEEEIQQAIESAYSNTNEWKTKFYEDEDKVNSIRTKLKRGVPKKDIRIQLAEEENLEKDVVDVFLNRIDNEDTESTFWTKDQKGKVSIYHKAFKDFLEVNGFYKFCPEGGKSFVFVRITNNLIDHTTEKDIKDFVLSHLLKLEDVSIYNYFADSVRYFREEFLTLLDTIEVYLIEDKKDSSYLYYKNCAVNIGKGKISTVDYLELNGYVWKDHIIDRKFKVVKKDPEAEFSCDYEKFISRICNDDPERIKTMVSTIGYMMHSYKTPSQSPAIILNDEVISDSPEGGTGKGLFMSALGQLKKVVTIDGKTFDFSKSFLYQLVSADTQILCFDDVKKAFAFERLFSIITEGLTLEKKNKDAIKIPFERSPKVAITTNYAIKGSGNSFDRRKWEVELHQHYNKTFTPLDEFSRHLFIDWDDEEWIRFDNYMISCLQSYLKTGLVKGKFVNLNIRQLSAKTCHEFIEWCGLIEGSPENQFFVPDKKLHLQPMYLDFISDYPDYAPKSKMSVSMVDFYKWLVAYGHFYDGVPPYLNRDSSGRFMIIYKKPEVEPQTKLEL